MEEVGYIQKTGTNQFHNYKYASIEAVLEKVQPALVKCGLAITQSEVSHGIVADGNLMEAVYEFVVEDMPVTVAVDAQGTSVHKTGPEEWRAKIGKIPVAVKA